MSRGGAGNMLGVGGSRSNLSRKALRGGGRGKQVGGGTEPQDRKKELLRRFQEKQASQEGTARDAPDEATEEATGEKP
ncbi:DUF6243 family protein [Streptomyces sp. NPDC001815]|uniref:DUF6243 family protein n=1 Tax=Streptomyces sp. NPDC001815 TaxID=3154526 RepID=UPI00331704C2